jgi:hypothetical protein
MLIANLKFIKKNLFVFSSFFAIFYIKNKITNDSYFRSKYLRASFAKNKHVNYESIKHKEMSFVSNGGKFKLYTVRNGLLFQRLLEFFT